MVLAGTGDKRLQLHACVLGFTGDGSAFDVNRLVHSTNFGQTLTVNRLTGQEYMLHVPIEHEPFAGRCHFPEDFVDGDELPGFATHNVHHSPETKKPRKLRV